MDVPEVPDRAAVERAARGLQGRVRTTPVAEVELGESRVVLKLEQLQHTGSFKARGAFWSVLDQPEQPGRLVAASGGNHGLAVAHVGQQLGIPTEVFVPRSSHRVKVAAIRDCGAAVTVTGEHYAEALEASRDAASRPGVLAVHAYDAPETVAGQGTVGHELATQAPDVDTVLVAVGGGGLAGGITARCAGESRVVAVEPEGCASYHRALAAGGPVTVTPSGVASDALGAARIGRLGFAILRSADVASVLVADEAILAARRWLWHRLRLAVEPAGATALAALLSGAFRPARGERVAVVLCGANTDPGDLA